MALNKQAVEYAINATPDERKYLCDKDFSIFFIYYFLHYIKYPFAPFHYDWIEAFNKLTKKEISEVALIGFRESAKTSIAKIYIIYLICYKKKNYINIDSFDKENAERFLFDIVVELQQNNRLIADFGQLFNTKRSSDEATVKRINNFITNNGVRLEAHSTQESIRGRIHGNQRPDLILFDDIETNKTRESKAYTKQVADHLSEALSGISADEFTAIYLGNYITDFGNIAELEKRAKGNDSFYYSKVAILKDDKPTWESKYSMNGEDGKVSIQKIKERLRTENKGTSSFMAEYMNEPIDESTQEFKKEWFLQTTMEEVYKKKTNCFILIDTAMSEKEKDDDSGVSVVWVDRENFWYVRAFPKRVNPADLINLIFDLHSLYKPLFVGIEKTMYSTAIKPFLQEEMRKRNVFPAIKELEHKGRKKEVRIRGLIPRYEAKAIRHIDSPVLEEQLLQFPLGQRDDVCLVGETRILTKKGQIEIKDVVAGDFVMTRDGYKKVLWSGKTGDKKVITNIGITGTPNHPVFTTKGLKDLQYVDESDIIYIWNEKLLCIEKKNITDIQSLSTKTTEDISTDTLTGKKLQWHYTGRCGLIIMEKFLQVFTYITKMVITTIIALKTLKLFQLRNTQKNTPTSQKGFTNQGSWLLKIWRNFKRNLDYGERQKKEKTGIKNTQRILYTRIPINIFVGVAKILKQQLKKLNTVLQSVRICSMQEFGEKDIQNTETNIKRSVYNLKVADNSEFIANNILVHNCDSFAYSLDVVYPPYDERAVDFLFAEEKPKYPDIGV